LREDSAFSEGAQLIAKNDCFTCHKIEEQSIGPSYQAIAKKYELNEANVQNLAYKIRHGSQGAWGNVEMVAHPLVSEAEAQKMATYILSLR
jgi:cytochrome c